jgi:hypothetical protein
MSEVDRILAARCRTDGRAKLIEELANLSEFVQSVIAAAIADDSEESWEKAYDAVFSDAVSIRIFFIFNALGMGLDYYDPDTTYEEDVRAFASAVHDKVWSLT